MNEDEKLERFVHNTFWDNSIAYRNDIRSYILLCINNNPHISIEVICFYLTKRELNKAIPTNTNVITDSDNISIIYSPLLRLKNHISK